MDLCTKLERRISRTTVRGFPPEWVDDPVLGSFSSLIDVALAVRRPGPGSEVVSKALLARPIGDRWVVPVVLAALAPMAKARCGGRDDWVDDLATELAIVVAEAQCNGLPESARRSTSLLLDRAWDRHREPIRRPEPVVPFDPVRMCRSMRSTEPDPEEVAVCRVALLQFRDGLVRCGAGHAALVRAWNSTVELIDSDRSSRAEQDRWKYSRKALRNAHPDLVA